MTAIIAFLLQLVFLVQPATHGERTRVVIADGSVWADIVSDAPNGEPAGEVVHSTTRLCDADASTRWIAADVDGDGRQDLVAIHVDGWSTHVELWHNGFCGFARQLASPRHLVRPLVHALREALANLLGLDTPLA